MMETKLADGWFVSCRRQKMVVTVNWKRKERKNEDGLEESEPNLTTEKISRTLSAPLTPVQGPSALEACLCETKSNQRTKVNAWPFSTVQYPPSKCL